MSVLDQGLSSFTNFAVTLLAASHLDRQDFGAFALAMIVYIAVVPAIQAAVSQELVLASGTRDAMAGRVRSATIVSAAMALCASLLILPLAWAWPEARGSILALALLLPGLQMQDTLRFGAAALSKLHVAIVSDGLWLLFAVGGLALLFHVEHRTGPALAVMAWAAAGVLAAAATAPFLGLSRATRRSLSPYRSHRFVGYRFLLEHLAVRSMGQILGIVLGAIAGLSATGALRGTTVLLGPVTVVISAALAFGVPLLRSAAPRSRERVLEAMGLGLALLAIICGVIVAAVPDRVGTSLLGPTWEGARAFVFPVAVQLACSGMTAAALIALRLIDPRSTLAVRVYPAAAMPVAFGVGFLMGGPTGAVWGIAIGSAFQTVAAVTAYLRHRSGPGSPTNGLPRSLGSSESEGTT